MDRASLREGRVVGGSAWIAALGKEVVYEEDLRLLQAQRPPPRRLVRVPGMRRDVEAASTATRRRRLRTARRA